MDINTVLESRVSDHVRQLSKCISTARELILALDPQSDTFISDKSNAIGALKEANTQLPKVMLECKTFSDDYVQFVTDVYYTNTGYQAGYTYEFVKDIIDIVDKSSDMFNIFPFMERLANAETLNDLKDIDVDDYVITDRSRYSVFQIIGSLVIPFYKSMVEENGNSPYVVRALSIARNIGNALDDSNSILLKMIDLGESSEFETSAINNVEEFNEYISKLDTGADTLATLYSDAFEVLEMLHKSIIPISRSTDPIRQAIAICKNRAEVTF